MAVRVRGHKDGSRFIIYATYRFRSVFEGEADCDIRGGELLTVPDGDMQPIVEAVRRVAADSAERIGEDHFALDMIEVGRNCIADLPALELM
jgi:hypothetical protein